MAREPPLISCIMPTRDRHRFAAQAIRYFRAQDYPRRELVIVDDGEQALTGLDAGCADIRYLRLPRRATLGEKRNLACEAARGEIIAHWDDDDWMAPWRLRYQLERLRAAGAGLCGLSVLLHYDVIDGAGWQYAYPARPGRLLAGGTLCYRRSLWRRGGFEAVNDGEDTRFLLKAGDEAILALADHRFYVAIIHGANTSRRRIARPRWMPCGERRIRALLGDAWEFYAGLAGAA